VSSHYFPPYTDSRPLLSNAVRLLVFFFFFKRHFFFFRPPPPSGQFFFFYFSYACFICFFFQVFYPLVASAFYVNSLLFLLLPKRSPSAPLYPLLGVFAEGLFTCRSRHHLTFFQLPFLKGCFLPTLLCSLQTNSH